MTEITLPPLPRGRETARWAEDYVRLAMAPLQERIRELEQAREIDLRGWQEQLTFSRQLQTELAALKQRAGNIDYQNSLEQQLAARPVADGKAQELQHSRPCVNCSVTFGPNGNHVWSHCFGCHNAPTYRTAPVVETPIAATAVPDIAKEWKSVAFRLAEDRLTKGTYDWTPQQLLDAVNAEPPTDTRAKALEEAVKICEVEAGFWTFPSHGHAVAVKLAAAIRAAITGKP